MNNRQARLIHATNTIRGTLVQLDYLQDLVDAAAMSVSKRQAISDQIARIRLNNNGAADELTSASKIPVIGNAM